jgi:dipeptidyl aminopeptidase/acylaminoacyl peptidase
MARLWDALTGKAIGQPMVHRGTVTSAQFSPDGQRVVTSSDDGTARLWDGLTGKAIGEPLQHDGAVNSAQFSPDGQRVLTASEDNTARVWDAATGKIIGEPLQHKSAVNSAQFSPDGQQVLTASLDKTARVWDAATGKAIGEPLQHDGAVNSAQFSPDGQWVVTASDDGTARLWDGLTGKAVGEPMRHEGQVRCAWFSLDDQLVITASDDGTARLWEALTGKAIGEPMKHGGPVQSARFSPDGERVVTASDDGTARLWDVAAISNWDNTDDVLLLADLAETEGGVTLHTSGRTEILSLLPADQVRAMREKIAARFRGRSSDLAPLQRFLKWGVGDRRSRTISPFSELTVAEWVENRIKEGTADALRAAIQVDPANATLAAHFGWSLADYALRKGIDPAEARRALAEADFQTHRAQKLAPDNDQVKKVSAEVVKLLAAPTPLPTPTGVSVPVGAPGTRPTPYDLNDAPGIFLKNGPGIFYDPPEYSDPEYINQ